MLLYLVFGDSVSAAVTILMISDLGITETCLDNQDP